jgi:hypothetical protein
LIYHNIRSIATVSAYGIITTNVMDSNKDMGEDSEENALEAKPELNALDSLSSQSGVHEEGKADQPGDKKPKTALKKLWAKINIYFLVFMLLLVLSGIVFIVTYLKSQKEPELPTTALQNLTQQDLSEIASGDSKVGDPRYVLNIQSNAVFAGNALVRGDLSVAGNILLGKALSVPGITVSGNSNLGTAQINTLSVANASTLQGAVSMNGTLSVQGRFNTNSDASVGRSMNVGGTLTAARIVTGSLTLSSGGTFTFNNHIKATGATPGRSQGSAVGGGGSTSISGSDLAGTVNINTGNSPSPGCFITVNFVQRYDATPRVIISPVGAGAGQTQYYVNRSATSFSICTANSAPAGQSFAFDYWIVN